MPRPTPHDTCTLSQLELNAAREAKRVDSIGVPDLGGRRNRRPNIYLPYSGV
jgi:hypothetical protein